MLMFDHESVRVGGENNVEMRERERERESVRSCVWMCVRECACGWVGLKRSSG